MHEIKCTLKADEYIVQHDFAENYSFILHDKVQGFHWNKSQTTIHPFVIYFKNLKTSSIDHISFVVISDCIQHETISGHLLQHHLIKFLSKTMGTLPKYKYYFSDGAAADYKNRKNFINLRHHEKDFDIPAFATAHGKGPCDGIAGKIKRLACSESLQR